MKPTIIDTQRPASSLYDTTPHMCHPYVAIDKVFTDCACHTTNGVGILNQSVLVTKNNPFLLGFQYYKLSHTLSPTEFETAIMWLWQANLKNKTFRQSVAIACDDCEKFTRLGKPIYCNEEKVIFHGKEDQLTIHQAFTQSI